MLKRQDCGDGPGSLKCNPNLKSILKRCDQISKPQEWLRRNAMAPPRQNKQRIKCFEQGIRRALLKTEVFSFRSPNFSLRRVLMEITEKGVQARSEIELMMEILFGGLKVGIATTQGMERAHFKISSSLVKRLSPKRRKHLLQHMRIIDQRIAMIGERQRNHPTTGQPTVYFTQHDCIG